MFNGTLTLITKIRPGAEESLVATLKAVDHRIQAGAPQPFEELEELHFAHWAIMRPPAGSQLPSGAPGSSHLIFGVDLCLPGLPSRRARLRISVEHLVDGLLRHGLQPGVELLDAIYRHCEDYPERGLEAPSEVKAYLLRNAVKYTARHVDFAYRVTTVQGIQGLMSLRAEVEEYLNDRQLRPLLEQLTLDELHQALRERLGARLAHLSGPEWDRRLASALLEAARATVGYALPGLFVRLATRLAERFRKEQRTLGSATIPDPLREEIDARQHPVQNSMILVSTLPEGRGARFKQWLALRLVNWRVQRNVVGLNDIRAIHFARWVSFDRGSEKRLIFMVTYDESWDAYIDSFIDNEQVSRFLKAIWHVTKGFPQGKPFVEPFKAWIRSVQCPTLAWYSAYRHGRAARQEGVDSSDISVTDLHEALQLRRVLARESLHGPGGLQARRALRSFLELGRFPFQKKVMGLGVALFHVLADRTSRIRLWLEELRRTLHAALGEEGKSRRLTVTRAPDIAVAAHLEARARETGGTLQHP
ncbi:MAG: hypothetical protein JXB05_06060 [Myxococcaceae bacterium]|nr:hypothetical protein [Myxococcaceae bacterium]